jgi:hypothetical protein
MIFILFYDASSLDIVNYENSTDTTTFEHTLGRYIIGLDPIRQGHEKRFVSRILNRLGLFGDRANHISEKIIDALRTKEHLSLEIYY